MRRTPVVVPTARTFTRQTLEEIVAENLKKYRKAAKLTQGELALEITRLGYDLERTNYSRAESGVSAISLALLDACAVFYRVAPTVFLIPSNGKRLIMVDDNPGTTEGAPTVTPNTPPNMLPNGT